MFLLHTFFFFIREGTLYSEAEAREGGSNDNGETADHDYRGAITNTITIINTITITIMITITITNPDHRGANGKADRARNSHSPSPTTSHHRLLPPFKAFKLW